MPFLATAALIWYGIYCLPFAWPRLRIAIGAVADPRAYQYAAIGIIDWIGIAAGAALMAWAWIAYIGSWKRWRALRRQPKAITHDPNQWPPQPKEV